MKVQCIIIDDEPLVIELIKTHIAKFPNLEMVASCHNAMEGFEVLKSKQVDLIFLDIQMPLLTGIEFLKSLSNPQKIIFTTAFREYAVENYELEVVDYLLKPISFDRFFKAINKYFKVVEHKNTHLASWSMNNNNSSSFININKKHFKVLFSDIMYVESLKNYIQIHTIETVLITKNKVSDFEHKLPGNFLRTHRSYIVNLDKITAFTTHDIEIGRLEIPIGVSYKHEVLKVLKRTR